MYFRSRQGSVLGRLLFPTYTSPITMITRSIHDTQLFIAINPSVPSSDIIKLTSCLDALQSWLCLNGMALNPDKSDAILLGTESHQRSSCYTSLGFVNVAGSSVPLIHQSSPKIWLRPSPLPSCLHLHLFLAAHPSTSERRTYNVRKLHRPRMSDGFLTDIVDMTSATLYRLG